MVNEVLPSRHAQGHLPPDRFRFIAFSLVSRRHRHRGAIGAYCHRRVMRKPKRCDRGFPNVARLTNASIGYRSDHGWEVSVFARNLFNENYIQNLTIQAGNSGLILGTPSDPRTVGITLRAWQ
jgi:hypothetical protein